MSQPEQSNVDVTIGATGFNPYRLSQFQQHGRLDQGGHERGRGQELSRRDPGLLNCPNMVLDLRIPQNQRYQQIVLDTAVARYLAGEIDIPTTMKTIEDGWNEITDELGRDDQLAAYKSTLGAK